MIFSADDDNDDDIDELFSPTAGAAKSKTGSSEPAMATKPAAASSMFGVDGGDDSDDGLFE